LPFTHHVLQRTPTHRDLAAKNRLPAVFQLREFVEAGGSMVYGTNIADLLERAATYVDKILDFSVLVYDGDEDGEPVYRVAKDRIKVASTAAVLARKLTRDNRAARVLAKGGE
jgi:hypothetical protein